RSGSSTLLRHRVHLVTEYTIPTRPDGRWTSIQCAFARVSEGMRFVVYTGKGGVGKTSIAAATAVRAAELGHRTLVLSTDLAHSLADSLDLPLGPEPTEVAPLLWAQEPDVRHSMQTHWGSIQASLTAALAWR